MTQHNLAFLLLVSSLVCYKHTALKITKTGLVSIIKNIMLSFKALTFITCIPFVTYDSAAVHRSCIRPNH